MKKDIAFFLSFALLTLQLTACGTEAPPTPPQVHQDTSSTLTPNSSAPTSGSTTSTPDSAVSTPDSTTPTPDSAASISSPTETNNPLLQATFSTAEVKSGMGNNTIGKRGFINISKADLKNITNEQFTQFANEKVADSGLNWVSIICEDGTGICFAGSMSYIADYGTLDEDGGITKQIGVIMLEESGYSYEQTNG